jgi:hypothetical protein
MRYIFSYILFSYVNSLDNTTATIILTLAIATINNRTRFAKICTLQRRSPFQPTRPVPASTGSLARQANEQQPTAISSSKHALQRHPQEILPFTPSTTSIHRTLETYPVSHSHPTVLLANDRATPTPKPLHHHPGAFHAQQPNPGRGPPPSQPLLSCTTTNNNNSPTSESTLCRIAHASQRSSRLSPHPT